MGMIRAELNRYRGNVDDLSDEDWAGMRSVFPGLPDDRGKDYWGSLDAVVDTDDLGDMPASILQFIELKPIRRLRFAPSAEDIRGAAPEVVREIVNNTYQVHLPGSDLLAVREVTWLEDACTNDLQSHLGDGWRILAVCPQPGSRRPDYVLGKLKDNG